MTDEQINQLEPGRETDILIAEMLTGRSRLECRTDPMNRDGEPQFYWGYPAGHDFAPEYSTSIAATFEMEAEISRRNLEKPYIDALIEILRPFVSTTPNAFLFALTHASPLNRCRAALRAAQSEGK